MISPRIWQNTNKTPYKWSFRPTTMLKLSVYIKLTFQQNLPKKKSRLINDQTIGYFQWLLTDETWNQVYNSSCTNEIFNKFHNIVLRHYEASLPIVYSNCISKQNWIARGIKISCANKRELFLRYRENKENIQVKNTIKNTAIY